jgi:hypothetical protein
VKGNDERRKRTKAATGQILRNAQNAHKKFMNECFQTQKHRLSSDECSASAVECTGR